MLSSGGILLLGKTVLWFLIPLALIVWDLRKLKQDKLRYAEAARQDAEGAAAESSARS